MPSRMFVLRGLPRHQAIDQDVKVRTVVEMDVKVQDGDEVVCEVVGVARVFGGGHEVEITEPRFERVVEVRKAKPS